MSGFPLTLPQRTPDPGPRQADPVVRLMAEVNRKFGFRVGDQLEKRVMRYARGLPPDALRQLLDKLERLPANAPEWLSFIEQLTVHETYFFREREQLLLLVERHLRPLIEQRRRNGQRELRLWSAACSTGEEVYSVAMLVVEELIRQGEARESDGEVRFVQPWRLTLMGSDIARPAIRHAEEAVYRAGLMSSFRDMPPRYQVYFDDVGSAGVPVAGVPSLSAPPQRRVKPSIRNLVRFQVHNLIQPTPALQGCDAVLCRNVLIYFDDAARNQAIERLIDALTPGGALLLGTTDYLSGNNRLVLERGTGSTFYRRVASGVAA